jgi:lipopolysaccharide heptosyltransferase I
MNPEPPERLLIVRLGSLGDLIHALPAAAALRDAWPDAEIDWLVEPAHAELLKLVPILSNVVTLKGRSAAGWWATRGELRRRRYDVAIDLQGLVKSAALAWLSGARRVIGFDTAALREPAARFFYTEQIAVGEGRHVIDKNLALAKIGLGGGFNKTASEPDFPLKLSPSPALESLRASGVTDFALLNPGAAWPNKRWPPESFAAVATWLHATYGWTPVVLWGPGEGELADDIVRQVGGVAVRAPETSFNDLLALAREAKLFVSGDTGPLHFACAMGTPVVALFGPTTPARNGPWDDQDVSISRYDQCDCHYQRQCRRNTGWCLGTITVDDVTTAITARVGRR